MGDCHVIGVSEVNAGVMVFSKYAMQVFCDFGDLRYVMGSLRDM